MQTLDKKLNSLINELKNTEKDILTSRLNDLESVYPFNRYEFIISSLISFGSISFDEYISLRDDYIARNRYLFVFEISAPRGFGETWAEGHLKSLSPELIKPSKSFDSEYSGQYDFLLDDNIRIEVKASRAVDADKPKEPLYVKALSSSSTNRFTMNFQQIKPACCDVFVWVGVWRDEIRYWVLSSKEVVENPFYSKGQHRGNSGEGQLHLKESNIAQFSDYQCTGRDLLSKIIEASSRNN